MMRLISVLLVSIFLFTSFCVTNCFALTYGGNEKVLIVLVEFSETETSLLEYEHKEDYDGIIRKSEGYINRMFFSGQDNVINRYFKEVSNGKLNLIPAEESYGVVNDGVVRIRLPYPNPYPNLNPSPNNNNEVLFRDMNNIVDKYVDFSSFDVNKDNTVEKNELHVVYGIASAEAWLAPSFVRFYSLYCLYGTYDGVDVKTGGAAINAGFKGDYTGYSEFERPGLMIVAHEMAHGMEAYDLYKNKATFAEGLTLMDNNYGNAYLDPEHKIRMGFVTPTIVTSSGTYTVNSLDPNNLSKYNVLKVPIKNSGECNEEYFLIENRQYVGFDESVGDKFISGGVAIWHVEGKRDSIFCEIADDKTYPTSMNGQENACNWLYYSGGNGKTYFGANSVPKNSKTNDGEDSGISITVNSPSSNSMSVTVDFLNMPQNLRATMSGNKTLLKWDAVQGATEYELSVDSGPFFSVGSRTQYIIANINKHSYRVRALNTRSTSSKTKELCTRVITYGDLDFSGVVNTLDRNLLLKYLSEEQKFTTAQKMIADVDGDNDIDLCDLNLITSGIASGAPVPVFPAGQWKIVTYGDVNGDGIVTTDDRNIIYNSYDSSNNKITNLAKRVAADTKEGDGIIDSMDYYEIDEYLKGIIKKFGVMFLSNLEQ